MEKKEIMVIVVEMAADGTFGCYPEDEKQDFGVAGYGDSSEKAKTDFFKAYDEIREEYAKLGKIIPDYDFEFRYDIRSFFDYFDCFNSKKIAEKAGINYTQLNQYLTGHRKASRLQYEKLAKCVKQISSDLQQAIF